MGRPARYLTMLLLLIAAASGSYAQQCHLSGKLLDSVNFQSTQETAILFQGWTDSLKGGTAYADVNGKFHIILDSGSYRMRCSNPLFPDYTDTILVAESYTDAGIFYMPVKTHMLTEVAIRNRPALLVKGDTTEYNADSFAVAGYGTVADLLKILPGIEMDETGKFMSAGKSLDRILVDGETFFLDDPASVSRVLRAAAIDKVQLYDQGSEHDLFTGIDKGSKTRIINLVLREEAKHGYFGKIKVSAGPPHYYDNHASLNDFRGKRKIAGYGNLLNTGAPGNGNPTASQGQQGLSRIANAGLHYDNKWLDNNLSIAGNYKYSNGNNENTSTSNIRYILPDSQYQSNQDISTRSASSAHSFSTNIRYAINTSSYFKLNAAAGSSVAERRFSREAVVYSTGGQVLNTQDLSQQSNNVRQNLDLAFFLGKHFGKASRTLTFDLKTNWNADNSNMILHSKSNFRSGLSDSLNQKKNGQQQGRITDLKMLFSDAICKRVFWELGYRIESRENWSRQMSYDLGKNMPEGQELPDSLYSSHYRLRITIQQIEANLKLNLGSWNLVIGASGGNAVYNQKDFFGTRNYSYAAMNFTPEAKLNYNRRNTGMSFGYNGQTQAPVIDQLQPLVQNADPLNVYLGNPDLKQEFRHQFAWSYNYFGLKHNSNFFTNAGYTLVQNAINLEQYTEASGRNIYRYANGNSNMSGNLAVGYGGGIPVLHVKASTQLEASFARTAALINGVENKSLQKNYTATIALHYFDNGRLEMHSASAFNYTAVANSVQAGVPATFRSYLQNLSVSYSPLSRLKAGSSLRWLLRQKMYAADNQNNIVTWNASLSLLLLRNRSLQVGLSAQDILNQNKGFSRSINNNIITDVHFAILQRYFLLYASWDFSCYRKKSRQ